MKRLLLLSAALAACTSEPYDAPIDGRPDPIEEPDGMLAQLDVSAPTEDLVPGWSFPLDVVAFDDHGKKMMTPSLRWMSSAPQILEVSDAGVVIARSAGIATISATSGGVTGTIDLGVREQFAAVARVQIVTPTPWGEMEIGENAQLGTVVYDADDNVLVDRKITWSSASAFGVAVTPSGKIFASSAGTVQITAHCEGVDSTLSVTVREAVDHIGFIGGDSAAMTAGTTRQIAVTAYDGSNTPLADRTVSYVGGHPAIARVSPTGLITAVGNGTTTITASIGNTIAKLTVKVQTVERIQLDRTDAILAPNASVQLAVTAFDTNNEPVTGATWSSSDASIATVSASGVVVGRAEGTATISATVGGKSASAQIAVAALKQLDLTTVNGAPAPSTMFTNGPIRQDLDEGVLMLRPFDNTYQMIVMGEWFSDGARAGYRHFASAGTYEIDAATKTYRFTPDAVPAGPAFTGRATAGGFEVSYQAEAATAPATIGFQVPGK